tara:strand:+ start:2151 stop:2966 length:816 start_codon:yes stop_codon:yes gene_type:complete
MKTKKKYKKKHNKTVKKNIPSIKFLPINYPIYKAYDFDGKELLPYKMKMEKKTGDSCLLENSSWFGNLEVAKEYKTSDREIYKWDIKIPTNLLSITHNNINFIENLFLTSKHKLEPLLNINKNISYNNNFLLMNNKERSLYEFKFVFGYLTIKEQYEFLLLIKFLIENNYLQIERRGGESIIKKLNFKIAYYNINKFFNKKDRFNRISIYKFDKYAIMNLCRCLKHRYNITGVYQKNDTSFWFPSLGFYKMNIKEYIFFNPAKNLKYNKKI